MPGHSIVQQAYLGGVLFAFVAFMVALAWGHFQSNRPSANRG